MEKEQQFKVYHDETEQFEGEFTFQEFKKRLAEVNKERKENGEFEEYLEEFIFKPVEQ